MYHAYTNQYVACIYSLDNSLLKTKKKLFLESMKRSLKKFEKCYFATRCIVITYNNLAVINLQLHNVLLPVTEGLILT